jgi:hypothetical protein
MVTPWHVYATLTGKYDIAIRYLLDFHNMGLNKKDLKITPISDKIVFKKVDVSSINYYIEINVKLIF